MTGPVRYAISAAAPPANGNGGDLAEPLLAAGQHYGGVVPPPLVQQPVNLVRSSRNPGGDSRWTNGFSYLPLNNGELDVADDCGPTNISVPVESDASIVDWYPYILYAHGHCSSMGIDQQGAFDRVRNFLDVATPKLIEYEFWNGRAAQGAGWPNLYLKQSGVQTYAASTILQAVAICEQYLSDIGAGARGMIHMPAYVSPYLQLVCRREGNLLLTNRDTIVVPGGGYANPADPPTYPPAGAIPIFATGITDVRMTEIVPVPDANEFGMALDRATNTVSVGAWRYAVASWDGIPFCRVDLTLPA